MCLLKKQAGRWEAEGIWTPVVALELEHSGTLKSGTLLSITL